ncbi:VCBS repeat-containing protein [bacterium]|nr:VCBS repeat-containing protein [bacterium]
MRVRLILPGLVTGALLLSRTAPAQQPLPDRVQVTLPCPGTVTEVRVLDIDGNGLADIAASHTDTGDLPRPRRGLMVFLQESAGSFGEELRIDPGGDCLLWDVADSDADGRAELLLLKSDGVYLAPLHGSGFEFPPHRIVQETSFIPAAGKTLPRYPLALPLPGNSGSLIVLPAYGTLNLYRGDGLYYRACRTLFWRAPLSFGDASALSCTVELPLLTSGHFNRDDEPDLMLVSGTTLNVFLTAAVPAEDADELTIPDKRYLLDSRAISPSVFENISPEATRIETIDLDGDGFEDVVISKSPRARFRTGISQVQIFLNRNGRIAPLPDQILTTDHFSGDHIIADLNGDGRQDIALLAYPLGFAQAARFLLTKRTANRYELFFMRPDGSYPALPDGTVPFTRAVDLNDPLDEAPLRSVTHDFSGDGIRDFLVAADPDRFTVYPGTGSGLFTKKGRFRIDAPAGGDMHVADLNGDGIADLVLWGRETPGITLCLSRKRIPQ